MQKSPPNILGSLVAEQQLFLELYTSFFDTSNTQQSHDFSTIFFSFSVSFLTLFYCSFLGIFVSAVRHVVGRFTVSRTSPQSPLQLSRGDICHSNCV